MFEPQYIPREDFDMRMKKKIVITIGLLTGLLLTGCGEKEINLEDYLSVSYSGPNGYATANVDFDYLEFGDAIVANGKNKEMSFAELAIAADNVKVSNDAGEKLSNNDTFTVKFEWDAKAAKELGLKYIGKDKKITVEGLAEVTEIDPFKDISIEYSGTAPAGKVASIKNNSSDSFLQSLRYSASKTDELSNGDKIIVKIDSEDVEQKALNNNYVVTQTEKEYEVEGLPYYISAISDIPDEMLEKMKKQSEDVIDAHGAGWEKGNKIVKREFIGNYLLTKKDMTLYGDSNYCYCVYKLTALIEGDDDEFSYYYYVRFRNIMILEDGVCSLDLTDYEKPYGSAFFGSASGEAFIRGNYYFTGYAELDSMFNNCITKNIADYTYESTVTE